MITSSQRWIVKYYVGEYSLQKAYRKLWWDDIEYYRVHERDGGIGEEGRWKHNHEYTTDEPPDLGKYNTGVCVEEKTIGID
jgi:hypothetical protein